MSVKPNAYFLAVNVNWTRWTTFMLIFNCSVNVRYACLAWSTGLPKYLYDKIESKRSTSTMYPEMTNQQALEHAKLTILYD